MADCWIFYGFFLFLAVLTKCQQPNVNISTGEPYSSGSSQLIPIDLGEPGSEKMKISITSPGLNFNDNNKPANSSEEDLPVFHDRMGDLLLSPNDKGTSRGLGQTDRMGEVGTGIAIKPQLSNTPGCEKHVIQGYEKQIALFRDIHKMKFYTSEQELDVLCQELKPVQSGLKQYNQNCVPNDLNFSQFFGGFEIIFSNLCNPNTYRTQFLKESPCINQTYTSVMNSICIMQSNDSTIGTSRDEEFKVLCKNNIDTLKCLKDAVTKNCSASTGEFLECYVLTSLGDVFTSNCAVDSSNCKGKVPNQTVVKENNYEVVDNNNSINTPPSVTPKPGGSDHSSHQGNFAASIMPNILFILVSSFYYFAVQHNL